VTLNYPQNLKSEISTVTEELRISGGFTGAQGPIGATGPNTVSTTTITVVEGLLKGLDGFVSEAVADTDYVTGATYNAFVAEVELMVETMRRAMENILVELKLLNELVVAGLDIREDAESLRQEIDKDLEREEGD